MNTLLLTSLALAPAFAVIVFVYWRDKFEKEPMHLLFLCFVFGVLSVMPAMATQLFCEYIDFNRSRSIAETAIYAFVIVGIGEELCKFLVLRFLAFPRKEFNEPYDGITYSVMIAMGFATIENIFYVLNGGVDVAILRMFTAVPSHATNAIMMGYFMGLAKFRKGDSTALQLTALMTAAISHGFYDFFVFLGNTGYLATGAIATLVICVVLSLRAIKLHQLRSPFRIMH